MSSPLECCDFDRYSKGVPVPEEYLPSVKLSRSRHSSYDPGFCDQYAGTSPHSTECNTQHEEATFPCTARTSLLRLPADIRNIIYHFTFFEPSGIHVDFNADSPYPRRTSIISNPDSTSSIFSLSLTCKEIYNETCNLPFWLNTTNFRVPILQDLWTLRHATFYAQPNSGTPPSTAWPMLPPCPGSRRRVIELPPASLTAKSPLLRQKAQEYVTLAMRLPHLDDIMSRLNYTICEPTRIGRLNKVHIHLGSQTNNVFIERFSTAWSEVLPSLFALEAAVRDLRVSFALRLSRRMVVDYEFSVSNGGVKCLEEMDRCVVVPYAGDITLPELATINSIRSKIWKGFFGEGEKPPSSFRLPQKTRLPAPGRVTNAGGFNEAALASMSTPVV
ncbi:hypothetical protein AC579_7977 [Pseudocercospora musae]|uniref:F-box domain-containing protein n=1 Tax=Pseudocercospora musae TaxID=113226 RepID=A0A139IBK0_9PEZI|nr:hypothetical protein AC579_7977 [Pseudocercospora musae]